MNIVGLDALVFGVEDMPAARQYLLDYGLKETGTGAAGGTYEALDGTAVVLRRAGDDSLPPANAPSPNLRETVYGVADASSLAAIAEDLSRDRPVRADADGTIHTVDDGGYAIAFRITRRRAIVAPHVGINVPGQSPGRGLNVCAANKDEETLPRSLSHVVYFVPDVKKAEAFYQDRLGFRVTDRFIGLGPFMRPAGTLEHHTLFMIQSFNSHMVGMNHFTFHLGSANEVLHSGWRFAQKGYKSFWGPGRHVMGSNYFWYFNSPFGGTMEFDADMDMHDDSWTPREMNPGADNSQIFLFEHRPKWAPGE
ncbi:MAG TPA: VOC family protein [Burkholderiaceae bacterium]|nr:VOC family protein [Burkholderiaceae bacterium]